MNLTAADVATAAVNYSFELGFERSFDYTQAQARFLPYWHHCFYYSAAYVAVIFAVQRYMRRRPPYQLRAALCAWSGTLAVFSLMGAWRVLPELLHSLREHGFVHSICDDSYLQLNRVIGFWSWAFMLSKLPELADTLFIVLRKQPLIFLHWYHHIATLCYVWYSCTGPCSTGRWFVALNYTVHGVMYAYYALKAARLPVPRRVAMAVTLGQLAQMVLGIGVNVAAYRRKGRGEACAVSEDNIVVSLALYFSFFVLFAHFFWGAYLRKKPAPERGGDAAGHPKTD